MKKFYVTTPIYYVNDKPHLGHAYTTVAADVLARFYRKRLERENVLFVTGTDEHGKKNVEAAAAQGLSPQDFVDRQSALFAKAWKALDIQYDIFARTTDPDHYAAVSTFMSKLHEKGDIYEGVYEGLYCVGCEGFLTEKELTDGKCPDHHREPQHVTEKNYFFKLSKYLDAVREKIEKDDILIEPAARKKEVLGLFKQGLEDFSVSREGLDWGVPIPWDRKHVMYVWVEALANYISFAGYDLEEERFQKWWPADVHFMAKDIIKFHAIYWPALLMAAGEKTPKKIFAHGFFSINGQKMSKSLGNVIDPVALVAEFGSDATRYLLLTQFPFGQDGDIRVEMFREKYNTDLADGLGNLVSRATSMVLRYLDGAISERHIQREYKTNDIHEKVTQCDFSGALGDTWSIIAETNRKMNDAEPWVLAKKGKMKEVEEILSESILRLRDIADILTPFLPKTAHIIADALSDSGNIQKPESLFEKK